ncbi:hypothetical protein TNCV_282041 [Trichonephila clavipes]|nr:hypothetical protein TNCV_282041 [Trichonephila clavipes]
MVLFGLFLIAHTKLHILHARTVTATKYPDKTLAPYVTQYAGDIGKKFSLSDNNAWPHRATLVCEYLEDQRIELT